MEMENNKKLTKEYLHIIQICIDRLHEININPELENRINIDNDFKILSNVKDKLRKLSYSYEIPF